MFTSRLLMFPQLSDMGPRSEPLKSSDALGPSGFIIPTDDYQADVILKEKKEDANTAKSSAATKSNARNAADRYAILQRKVEELEKIHNDGKKAHQADVHHLKAELARYQKSNAEHTDRQEKQKKHSDTLNARLQDLKKTSAADQAEIRDLRSKLRISEHQRNQLTTKQDEVGELRRSLQSLQLKTAEESRMKDRRLSELEKALVVERKAKEEAQAELRDSRKRGSEELLAIQTLSQKLEAETKLARTAISSAGKQEAALLAQLEDYYLLVAQVAQEYGRMARNTVPMDSHTSLQRDHNVLEIRLSRLQRKLANSESQVDELAHLIRQTNEENLFLSKTLEETQSEIAFYQDAALATPITNYEHLNRPLAEDLKVVHQQRAEAHAELSTLDTKSLELSLEYYRITCEQVLFEYALAYWQLRQEQDISAQHATALSSALTAHKAIATRLENAHAENICLTRQLKDATDLADSLKAASDSLALRIAEMDEKMAKASQHHEVLLKKERDAVRRLTDIVQQSRMREEVLRSEIEQLTTELTDAERYQEAYYSLSDEVGSLVARNQLAEEEASRLGRFNAEILGHNNPAQRVMYVDRIRRELAETKHKLLMLNREQEAAIAANNDLQQELDMYKSVMVPPDQKPRTTITRVVRAPLTSVIQNFDIPQTDISTQNGRIGALPEIRTLESIPSDMTIEEIT